ncbi:hypothetical protein [Streptomyces sp. NPDC016172]|uniref:hypothetical protein n=1 Tax=Streptomyces sp. NPDC016172 TaxID=3364964 RepID=UPI0037017DFD
MKRAWNLPILLVLCGSAGAAGLVLGGSTGAAVVLRPPSVPVTPATAIKTAPTSIGSA